MMNRDRQEGKDRHEECDTVKCHDPATKRLRIESDYHSFTGEMRTIEQEASYCDDHAEMWLNLDGVAQTRYEVIDNDL